MSGRESKFRQAVMAIHMRGEYPSARRVNLELGRKRQDLDGKECVWRRQIFNDLGIKLYTRGGE